ncbi:MAG: hypothetical protein SFX73_28190 [Kofleriaceae bacterium]|nr:hypothetical protein [Kofleriaceae bacterium]
MREVDGETCKETVAALVVVVALAIEASASEPPPAPDPALVPPPVPAPVRAAASARIAPHERWFAVGTELARYQGLAPDALFGVPVFATFGRAQGPRVRVAFARTEQRSAPVSAGSSAFRWTGGRLDGSPLRFVRGRFVVSPALGVAVGVLDGRGTEVEMPGGGARPRSG